MNTITHWLEASHLPAQSDYVAIPPTHIYTNVSTVGKILSIADGVADVEAMKPSVRLFVPIQYLTVITEKAFLKVTNN